MKLPYSVDRLSQAKHLTGLRKSSIYNKIRERTFPTQVRLGTRAVGWLRSDIDEWIAKTILASSQTGLASEDLFHGENRRDKRPVPKAAVDAIETEAVL